MSTSTHERGDETGAEAMAETLDDARARDAARDRDREANATLLTGASVAAIGALGAVMGAVCPLCVVAAPALLGVGAIQKWRARARRGGPGEHARAPTITPEGA